MTETPARILIVDDEVCNLRLMEVLLKAEGYVTESASNGEDALAFTNSFHPDLILLDVMMPGIDGFEVAGRLKLDPATKNIPIIMVTALDDRESRIHALERGAEEFLNKPIDRTELSMRVRNLLRLREFSKFLEHHNRLLEEQVADRTRELSEAYKDTIFTMVRAAEHKDEDTGAHVRRISLYSSLLAEALGHGKDLAEALAYASPMHDVGKIGIPDHILFKTTPFTPDEWKIMQTHSALGAEILQGSLSPYVRMGAEIALNHHERWDGTGYPNGISGEAIPLPARIMCLADVYDALRSKRPYKPAFSHDKAVQIILEGDGRNQPGHFDPAVLQAFKQNTGRFADIFATYADE